MHGSSDGHSCSAKSILAVKVLRALQEVVSYSGKVKNINRTAKQFQESKTFWTIIRRIVLSIK